MIKNKSVCLEADNLVSGDREVDYGDPTLDFQRTAQMGSAITGAQINAEHVPMCMIALKLSGRGPISTNETTSSIFTAMQKH